MKSWVEDGILGTREGKQRMARSSRTCVGSEGRIGTPLLNEIFERASELTTSHQRELVDELFEKAAEVGARATPSKTTRARRALERLETLTSRSPAEGTPTPEAGGPQVMGFDGSEAAPKVRATPKPQVPRVPTKPQSPQPAPTVCETRLAEASEDVQRVLCASDRTPAQGIVPLGAHYVSAKVHEARKAKAGKRTSGESRRRRKTSRRDAQPSSSSRRRRSRSSRQPRIEPISELPPLPNMPPSLPVLESPGDDYGFGFSSMDENHLAELDRLVANTQQGWAPRAPRSPRSEGELVFAGSESDDELGIF